MSNTGALANFAIALRRTMTALLLSANCFSNAYNGNLPPTTKDDTSSLDRVFTLPSFNTLTHSSSGNTLTGALISSSSSDDSSSLSGIS